MSPAGGDPGGIAAVRELHALADLVTPMAARVFVTLGVPDLLDARPRTVHELSELCACSPRILGRILSHLDARGVVRREPDGTFGLTDLGRVACDTSEPTPQSWLVKSLRMETLHGDVNHSIVSLLNVVRSGGTAYEEHFGEPLWDRVTRMDIDEARREFGYWIPVVDVDPVVQLVAAAGATTICDVGAGTGRLAYELLSRDLCAHCHVVDLAPMTRLADELLGDSCAGRYTVTEADFMTGPLPTADLYALCDVLADWDDASAVRLLRNVRESGEPDSPVLVTELTIPSGAGDLFDATAGELRLDVEMASPNRTVEQLSALGREADLTIGSTMSGQHRVAVLLNPA